ncbi:SusC/RagA family TonB-linked outer membrane protein [Rhodohalobacter sp. 614A]|uniref:SusC/RagA family TonB-linked outer membrane protein n=1 Tax=Rhodohalobacter sp. 614A TaxID=2908649 RepID=UPI001F2CD058|nr:TonB-dependent receptor [Rhodohalobacter sp. 614A]
MDKLLHTKPKPLILMVALFLCLTHTALGQEVSGIVTDAETSEQLPGVNIVVKGTTTGVSTDIDGNFNLIVPSLSDTLVFTFIGYGMLEVPINNRTEINVELSPLVLQGDELVVVGYGTQRAENLTGSVASVSTEDMADIPVPTVTHALQGMAPGLQLLDGGNRPGRNSLDLLIRGQGTLGREDNPGAADASRPLILIDGVEGDLATVDMDDVANISVLKDAASAAIYGSRAANGVILVTTKRGNAGERLQISYNGYWGMQDITAWPERVDTETHMRLANLARSNYMQWCLDGRNPNVPVSECASYDSYQPRYTEEYIQNTIAGNDPDAYPDNEWVDALFDPAPIQEHTLRISGGSTSARYALSLNYMDEGGMMANTGANRYGVRLNTDFQPSEKLSAGLDISANRRWDIIPAQNGDATFFLVHDTPPTRRTKYSDGTYGLNLFGRSPLAYAEISGDEQRIFWEAKVTGRLNYTIVPGWLEVRTLASFDYGNMDWELFRTDPNYIDAYPDAGNYWGPNYGENRTNGEIQTTLQAILDYGHTFNDTHDISGVVGYEQIDYDFEEFRASRDQFYSNSLRSLDLGNTVNDGTRGYGNEWGLRSMFGRLNYSILDRYLFEFNARYDGSSRFAEGHRYGFFPSFSAGWRLSDEPFFNVSWVDELKIRGSWGQLGNQNVPLYSYYSSINLSIPYYLGNSGGTQAVGGAATSLVNEDLSWETTTVTNFGVDATFLAGRLNFTGEIYKRLTEDILLDLPIPDMVGLDAPFQNAGSVENKGWELSLGWQDIVGDFNYGIKMNLSDNRNEVVDLVETGPYINGERVIQEGSPINAWYGWEAEGLFSSYEQIDNSPQPAGQETHLGDIIFKDQNNDGIINDEDRVIIGDRNPRYIFGVNLNFGWKNFDATMFFQGVGKRDQYLSLGFIQGPVWENYTSEWHKDYWTPENQDARHPAYYSNYNRNYYATNSWWVLDGSFVKLRNVQVGYTLPQNLLDNLGIQNLRLYVTGKNLWTHQNLGIGLDPEYPSTGSTRGDYYPQTKVISLGANISF